MRLFLNAGAGSLLGVDFLRSLNGLGFVGIRQDMPDADTARLLCEEIADARIQAILLVNKMPKDGPVTPTPEIFTLARRVAEIARDLGLFNGTHPCAIEIGNEPDGAAGYGDDPEMFAQAVRGSREAVRDVVPEAPIISGGIKATSREGLNYLEKAVRAGIPEDCFIGYHSYRTTQPPEKPMPGFASRTAEFERLRDIAGGRPIWCTEVGWHTSPSPADNWWHRLLGRKIQFTDDQVADFADREIAIHAQEGAQALAWYRHTDGDPNSTSSEDHFGILRADGSRKAVTARFAALGPVFDPNAPRRA